MKIVFQNVILLLSFVAYNYFCLANEIIKIGAFFNEDQSSHPINWGVIRDNIHEKVGFMDPETKIVPNGDAFESGKIFCESIAQDSRYLAVFGPKTAEDSKIIESICFHLGIPYYLTHWIPFNPIPYPTTLNLYPDAYLFSQGLATIVKSLDWKKFVIIYENSQNLINIQDILKIQQYKEGYEKNDILIKQFIPGDDQRSLLKEVKKSGIRRIILDCSSEKILDILRQAQEVQLIPDISTSFFLISLDAHTIDYGNYLKCSNMTSIRLFDPYNSRFQQVVSEYYPTTPPEKILVQTALQHDAMLLLAEAMKSLSADGIPIDLLNEPKLCNTTEPYEDDLILIDRLRKTTVPHGITGDINFQYGKREKFVLEVIELDRPEQPIAVWNSEQPESIHLTRNATQREAELQRRLMNHNFIVSSKIGKPYLMYSDQPDATGNSRYKGYSMDLITEIAKLMNITFEFVLTRDNLHSNIVDDLINRRADLGICDFTITHQRRELIDFSMPFMSLGISILHKESDVEQLNNMYAFMDPFSLKVWIYIVTLFLILSLIIVVTARLDPDDWENPHPCNQQPEELENIWNIKNCLWLTLGSIMTQGCDILPKGISSRILTAMWWFFSLIMTSSYTANMAAFLTVQKSANTINNVEDLANQNKVKYGIMKGGSTEEFFKYSNDSLYQKMWAVMKNENPSVFEDSNDKGVERVLSTKNALYAFFMESTQIEYELERKCELRKVGSWLDSKSYGIGMPFGADYRHAINSAVLKLQENGKLNELKEKWWKKDIEGTPCSNVYDEPVIQDELTLAHVGGVFVVLGCGICLAFLLAIVEFFWNIYNISVEEHMGYMEALECEIRFACNIFITQKHVKPSLSDTFSSKSDNKSMARTVIAGAGSFLNVNATVLNRIGNMRYNE
ncbi:glutamate receptor ionotropic, kainate 2-like [Sitophilus oryzae]|uniref:Glutamate receptor ionotropic, kainate 2-like n=1 Tax=Sitophilus oryzae TaxID=7048 RepID=A0A6J2XK02_SITOR|nr:glutamate receptor ionotropic, kainate 2-like [Sitophilus oryzae]